ncbi:MAG TPA: FAD-dependent oxidoreductase, partial [Burkholderiales bacterium]|nr:FAD-dependent oxidoreductase [Burkholderiales bacterium]
YLHDWQHDLFARGAYSYVTVGGDHARETLAANLKDTLYFAGEATDLEGEAGTVAGALQSGRRAAREAMGKL